MINKSELNLPKSISEIIKEIFSLKNITNDYNSTDSLDYCFKVLVFDDKVYSMISSLVRLYTLRENNICLNVNLSDKKEKMPNVMGIYIISATEENLSILKKDIENQIFDNFYINLVSYDISNNTQSKLLTNFYNEISSFNNLSSIANISILPFDILLYHERLFSLDIKNSYFFLNSPNISDDEYKTYISKVSNGLFSTLYALKTIPIIKFRTGYFFEDILEKLQNDFNYLFEKYPEKKDEFMLKKKDAHTLLIILDRDTDLPIMMHHASSLGSMANDIIGLSRGGNIKIKENEELKSFEVDPINDYVWNECATEAFYTAGKLIHTEYNKYKDDTGFLDKTEKVKNMEDLMKESEMLAKSIEKIKDNKLLSSILSQLACAYNTITKEANQRETGKLFEIEDNLLRKRNGLNNDIKRRCLQIINSIKNFNQNDIKYNDIYRLILMYYLCQSNFTQNELNGITNNLINKNALLYLKSKKEQNSSKSNKKEHNNYWHSGINLLMNSINSLMSVEQPSISADVVNSLFFNKKMEGFTTYNMYKKAYEKDSCYTFSDAIVFFVGGGSFGEFEYIDDLMKKNEIKTIYGCDYLYKPIEFVYDLEKLGKNEK